MKKRREDREAEKAQLEADKVRVQPMIWFGDLVLEAQVGSSSLICYVSFARYSQELMNRERAIAEAVELERKEEEVRESRTSHTPCESLSIWFNAEDVSVSIQVDLRFSASYFVTYDLHQTLLGAQNSDILHEPT